MRSFALALAFLWSAMSGPASAQQAPTYVRMKANDTIGCKDADKLPALRKIIAASKYKSQIWRMNIAKEECFAVDEDLRFRLFRWEGDLVLLQLAEDHIPPERSPALIFAIADIVTMDGKPFKPRR